MINHQFRGGYLILRQSCLGSAGGRKRPQPRAKDTVEFMEQNRDSIK